MRLEDAILGQWIQPYLCIPDLEGLHKETVREAGCWESWDDNAAQVILDFSPDDVKIPLTDCLGCTTGKVEVFAAYVHKFAQAISSAGFRVRPSDPCERWVNEGRKRGFDTVCAGVEALVPDHDSLAYVAFEPTPIIGG